MYDFSKVVRIDGRVRFRLYASAELIIDPSKDEEVPDTRLAELMLRKTICDEFNDRETPQDNSIYKAGAKLGQIMVDGLKEGISTEVIGPKRSGRFPWPWDGDEYVLAFNTREEASEKLDSLRVIAERDGYVLLGDIDGRFGEEHANIGWLLQDITTNCACKIALMNTTVRLKLPMPREIPAYLIRAKSRAATYKIDTVTFQTMTEARKVGSDLRHILNEYGVATVSDFHDLAGVTAEYEDTKFGWLELPAKLKYEYVAGGVRIKLPPTTHVAHVTTFPQRTVRCTDERFIEEMVKKYGKDVESGGDSKDAISHLIADMGIAGAKHDEMRRIIRISKNLLDKESKVAN